MAPEANHAILLTAPGSAAIAVLRLTGPGTAPFLARHFSKPVASGRCVHGELRDEAGEVIDDPVVVIDAAGGWADISVHGGPWVQQRVMQLAEAAGFTRAGFDTAARAETADPLEAELLEALPLARTELALRMLLAQPAAWRRLENASPEELRRMASDDTLHHLLHPPRVAIVGLPNVGKSTLANCLFAQERVITADVPGTTRDWVGEIANVDGLAVMLVDTPGLRQTDDPIEHAAIAASAVQIEQADLVLLLLDATQPMAVPQAELMNRFPRAMGLINKCDLAPVSMAGWAISAKTGQGIDALRQALVAHFCDLRDLTAARYWTQRQRAWIRARLPVEKTARSPHDA